MNKSSKIESFLKKEIPNITIDTASSYNSGLKKILLDKFNLILLDMTMPTFDKTPSSHGGKLIRYAGKEILGQMKRKKIHTPTIVITQYATFGEEDNMKSFDEMKKELFKEYDQFLVSMIYFEPDKADWEMNIIKLIRNG